MAVVYHIYCESCDPKPEKESWFDEETGYETAYPWGWKGSDLYLGYLNDDGELEVLYRYPSRTLEDGRETAGRIFLIGVLLCRQCGAENEFPKLAPGQLAFVPTLVVTTVTGIVVGLMSRSWVGGFAAAIVMLTLSIFIERRLANWRYAKNVAKVTRRCCVNCGGKKFISFQLATWYKQICPQCRRRLLRVRVSGIS